MMVMKGNEGVTAVVKKLDPENRSTFFGEIQILLQSSDEESHELSVTEGLGVYMVQRSVGGGDVINVRRVGDRFVCDCADNVHCDVICGPVVAAMRHCGVWDKEHQIAQLPSKFRQDIIREDLLSLTVTQPKKSDLLRWTFKPPRNK